MDYRFLLMGVRTFQPPLLILRAMYEPFMVVRYLSFAMTGTVYWRDDHGPDIDYDADFEHGDLSTALGSNQMGLKIVLIKKLIPLVQLRV